MGSIISRQNVGVEEVDISVSHAYKYPPKSGNYFSSHFIMGGERFDTAQPEMYLFGENVDLNFLGSRPAPFPYPAPSASEPSRTLKAVVNIRKESLRFVRVPDDSLNLKEPETRSPSTTFNIEFIFDCDVRCAITIMYFCSEEVTSMGLMYTPRDPSMNSETYHYKRGANQQFSQVCHTFDPSKYSEESLLYSFDREIMPIVIYCIAEEGEEPYQSHATIAVVEKHSDGYTLKPLKQKLFVDGLCYLLQEIYGIENKNTDSKVVTDDDPDDNGAECVICMCDLRDTLILPCRHLCLCNCCADSLRYQANNCPICRVPFRALLQIKALQKTTSITGGAASTNSEGCKVGVGSNYGVPGVGVGKNVPTPTPTPVKSGENIPAGYESVSLIEALNGPSVAPQQPPAPPYQNMYVQLPQNATDGGLDGSTEDGDNGRDYEERFNTFKGSNLVEDSMTQTDRTPNTHEANETVSKGVGTQMRMSVLMAQESEDSIELKSEGSISPSSTASRKDKAKFMDDSCSRSGETKVTKDGGDRSARRKSKKSNPQSPTPSTGNKENSLCGKPDDDEEIVETLRLLEQKSEGVGDKSGESTSLQGASVSEFKPQEAVNDSPESLPYDVENPSAEDEKINASSLTREGDEYSISMTEYESPRSQIQQTCESEFNPGKRKERRSSKKNKQKGLGHKHRTNPVPTTAAAYNPLHCSETATVGDDSSSVLVPENQSLPGTPLSHSSAVSRSSDASVSSASSTRALILSHPTQSSTVI